LKFAVCFEDRTVKRLVDSGELASDQVANHLAVTFRWLQDNWFSAPHYYHIGDQPLLLNFGPIYVTSPQDWRTAFKPLAKRPRFFALNHLWKSVRADGGFTWVYPQVWEGAPSAQLTQERLTAEYNSVTKIPKETIVSASPGFNDRYEVGYPDIAHRDGETLRETLTVCSRGDWPIVQLVTWNDFGEGTMIEPSHEFGYKLLEIVQEFQRKNIGQKFLHVAADLRLPEKLYRLRKRDVSRVKLMDEAAELLTSGKAEAARQLLERLSAASSEDTESSVEDDSRSQVRPLHGDSRSIQLASRSFEVGTIAEGKRF
jgi:hypothetical protein